MSFGDVVDSADLCLDCDCICNHQPLQQDFHHIPKLIRFGCSRFASAVGSDCNPLYPFRTDLASCRVDGLIKHHVDLPVNTVFILF
ncbi:TPA: hypothetical protein PXM78_000526 [Yersinia enterocolitica]|nr:hypothetical protein [Yersinia enterocolitica]HDL6907732.1 hypothetical protein [Yersinia enterocolitica]HDL7026109.1 hypothetical protein [Yersinia enterocolitica]HDL7034391.1 hypothetical protein [Yersinia enterocolitica]HDL7198739.1 hypothetical protein [Yersinia enterocolitica]